MKGADKFSSCEVTVPLTDLRGFTAVPASHPAPVLLEMLNRYLVKMSEIAISHGGTVDKFMGDAIMVLFGAPSAHADDVKRARDYVTAVNPMDVYVKGKKDAVNFYEVLGILSLSKEVPPQEIRSRPLCAIRYWPVPGRGQAVRWHRPVPGRRWPRRYGF